ncbi:MAG: glycogen/starch synthase [Bacillota bacterium]
MNAAFVALGCMPFVKTGGLADVAGALRKESGSGSKIFHKKHRFSNILLT